MDDGSPDVKTSLEMLKRFAAQNVDTVFATPHFYPSDESPERFLSRREKSYAKLNARRRGGNIKPEILLGAEVQCFPGMANAEAIDALCIQGTRLILVEMPFCPWSPWILTEIAGLQERGMHPVLAHINRYPAFRQDDLLRELCKSGVCLQINAEAFRGFFSARRASRLIIEECVQLIGSDCHNLTSRPPDLSRAAETLMKKYGQTAWTDFVHRGDRLLQCERNA